MRRAITRILIGSSALLFTATSATAGLDWCRTIWHPAADWPCCRPAGCTDNYCPKPAPCARTGSRFGCPDYCPKAPPPPCRTGPFTCDDYCPKPPPRLFCPNRCDPPR